MSARLTIEGLDELKAALRNLPRELADDAKGIVLARAHSAEARIKRNYQSHAHTGTLADSVGVKVRDTGPYGAGALVIAAAAHAHLFEFGTAARQSSQGWYRGVMPPAPPVHSFIPVMEDERRQMYEALADLLATHGLEVSGRGD